MAIKKKKKKKLRKPRRKRRGVSLSSTPVASSSSTASSSSSDSPSPISSASPSNNSSSATIDSAPETNSSSINKPTPKPSNDTGDARPKRRKKKRIKKRKVRPRKRKGRSLSETPKANTNSTNSNDSNTESIEIEITETPKQKKRRELNEKLAKARAEKIANLDPELREKIDKVISDHKAKIKKFADGLPEEKKAAFLAYSKNFEINSWIEKLKRKDQDKNDDQDSSGIDELTGLNEDIYNYDREMLMKLSPKKLKTIREIIEATLQKSDDFREGLKSDKLKGEFDDFSGSSRLKKMIGIMKSDPTLDSQPEEGDKEARKNSRPITNNNDTSNQIRGTKFKLLKMQNKGISSADQIREMKRLNEKLKELQNVL